VAKSKQPARRRHVPQRTCVACRRVGDKRDLVRVVRTPDAGVQVDLTGKLAGRGAYLCRAQVCWHKALDRSLLNKALKTTLTPDEQAALREFAGGLPEELERQADDPDARPHSKETSEQH